MSAGSISRRLCNVEEPTADSDAPGDDPPEQLAIEACTHDGRQPIVLGVAGWNRTPCSRRTQTLSFAQETEHARTNRWVLEQAVDHGSDHGSLEPDGTIEDADRLAGARDDFEGSRTRHQ